MCLWDLTLVDVCAQATASSFREDNYHLVRRFGLTPVFSGFLIGLCVTRAVVFYLNASKGNCLD